MKPPAHLPADVAAVWAEITTALGDDAAGPDLEVFCAQVARHRDASARISTEGLIVPDARGHPIAHPAIEVERRAQEEIRKWAGKFQATSELTLCLK